jgi:hypothetical protein
LATISSHSASIRITLFGDLGWGEVRGRVSDPINGTPIAGAIVTCQQRSNHPVSLCEGSVTTSLDGSFIFPGIFFQTTDVIELAVSEPGYGSQAFHQEFFTHPDLFVNFSLPLVDLTPHPCCTAPACSENEVYFCGGVCSCGCGTTCVTKTPTPGGVVPITPTPSITPTPITFSCVDCADFRDALSYFCPLAANDESARLLLNPYGEVQEDNLRGHACLFVVQPDVYLSYLYYVDLNTSTITLIMINPSLLSPTDTITPDGT